MAVSVALEGPRGREAGREEATTSPALATELLRGEGRKTTGGGGLGQLLGCTVLGLWALGKRQVLTISLSFPVFYFSAALWLY